jgi:hypothetical protein
MLMQRVGERPAVIHSSSNEARRAQSMAKPVAVRKQDG